MFLMTVLAAFIGSGRSHATAAGRGMPRHIPFTVGN